ncbi:MAG: hypothetical protein DRJ05_08305 [Bacteroidetes bacterium]|nr:MAG: hypothetical protein DRJ05_08305 [Bacteroidota bacterium]
MYYKEGIITNYKIMLGKPIIKGTRITVKLILRKLAEGATPEDIIQMYPHLVSDDIFSCTQYAD